MIVALIVCTVVGLGGVALGYAVDGDGEACRTLPLDFLDTLSAGSRPRDTAPRRQKPRLELGGGSRRPMSRRL